MNKLIALVLSACLLVGCTSTSATNECPVQGNKAAKHIRTNTCIETDKPKMASIPGLNFLWNMKSSKWSQDELTVCFLNGTNKQKEKVRKHAVEWEKYCGIKFIWLDTVDPNANIRVSFRCGGHWSYIGRYNKNVAAGKATMNIELGSFEYDDEWRRVVLHEFGHALGLEHEHRHPNRGFEFKEEEVYRLYQQTQGWSREQIYEQVISKANPKPGEWEGTEWDDTSIMCYEIPSYLTKDGSWAGWNTKLSEKDKEHIGKMYPKSE